MHSSLPSRSLSCIISLSLLYNLATSRHIHAHAMQRHRHHVRPIAAPALEASTMSTTSASIAAVTEGSTVVSDIQEIQNGLTNLPSDILNFVTGVEQRLQALERMLASILSGTVEPASPATTSQVLISISPGTAESVPPATTLQASATDHLPIPASTTSNPTSIPSSTLCLPPDGQGL
jgi:hypothetical protein